jgi:hypothetical protein
MGVVELQDHGAVGDGHADDSDAAQAAITAAATHRRRVRISGGVFSIGKGLNIPSNSTLEWDDGAILVARNGFSGRGMLQLVGAGHVSLINPRLDGNRSGITGVGNVGFFGVFGDRSSHVQVHGGYIVNLPSHRAGDGTPVLTGSGDAVYLTDEGDAPNPSDHWVIRDTRMADCDRNGLSVISARFSQFDGLTALRCGHAGIDIEPETDKHRAVALLVRNCVLNDNKGFGLVVFRVGGPSGSGHLAVVGNSIEQNGHGIHVQTFAPVSLVANVIRNNASFGVILKQTSLVTAVGNLIDDTHGNHVSVEGTQVTQSANMGWPA